MYSLPKYLPPEYQPTSITLKAVFTFNLFVLHGHVGIVVNQETKQKQNKVKQLELSLSFPIMVHNKPHSSSGDQGCAKEISGKFCTGLLLQNSPRDLSLKAVIIHSNLQDIFTIFISH